MAWVSNAFGFSMENALVADYCAEKEAPSHNLAQFTIDAQFAYSYYPP
jgi:hypothetical protein